MLSIGSIIGASLRACSHRSSQIFWKNKKIFIFFCLLTLVIIFAQSHFIRSFKSPFATEASKIFSNQQPLEDITIADISSKFVKHSNYRIYIDIGGFNGESVEHFIYFNPDSILYNILVFEPDPYNFQLCRERLSQKIYSKYNIFIIPTVAWVRDEKVTVLTGLGQRSRIAIHKSDLAYATQLDGIDFSSWLARIVKDNRTEIRIKISTTNTEIEILEKMILDETIRLPHLWDINWSDRTQVGLRARRIYIQSMLDSFGFDYVTLTLLQDERRVFMQRKTYDDVPKHQDWRKVPQDDAYSHYSQRPWVKEPILKTKSRNKRRRS